MKTILVTGAAGYIGRHVVKKALDMGYRVIASDFAFKGVDERGILRCAYFQRGQKYLCGVGQA